MPSILQMPKIKFKNPLGRVDISQDDIDISSNKTLEFWFSPKKSMSNGFNIRDRSSGLIVSPTDDSVESQLLSKSSFGNGADALLAPNTAIRPYDLNSPFGFNATSFSVAMVLQRSATDAGIGRILGHNGVIGADDYTPTMGFGVSGGQFTLWRGADVQRIQSQNIDFTSKPRLVVLTFSTKEGLKLYVDGVLNSSKPNDKIALTKTSFRFFQIGVATIASDAGFAGLIGDIMVFSDDLSSSENSFYLGLLSKTLSSKYGIS